MLVEKELEKRGGQVVAFFIDFKAAFDLVDRELLWKNWTKQGVEPELIERLREIYSETISRVSDGGRRSDSFWTEKGLRQGCPLSPTLFAAYIADLDESLRKAQNGGIVLGRTKVWSLAYADDIVLVAKDEEEMKIMMKGMEKYVDRKKMTLNSEKSKVLIFKRGRGKQEKTRWSWKDKEIEEVKEFKYLGYMLQRNNGPESHIRERSRKAVVAMRQTWGLGKRLFPNDFKRRMFLFDTLVKSVLLYGVEIWGWREEEVVERIQERYIRWVLELDTCTPGYIVREEAKRDKMRVDTGSRAWRYEMKVRKNENNNILLSNCTKELSKNRETALKGWMKRRTNYFWRNGWSVEEIERMEQAGIDSEKELKKRDKTSIETEQYNRLQEAKYNTWYKYIKTTELPRYLDRRGRKENYQHLLKPIHLLFHSL